MKFDELHDRLLRLVDAGSPEVLSAHLHTHANALGFDTFIYALRFPTTFAEARVAQVKGYPESWLDRYWDRGYFAIDPVIDYASHHALPIQWQDLTPRMSAVGRRMMGEAGEFGLRSGVSVPVHGPHGELGILSFARRAARPISRAAAARELMTAHLLSAYVHEATRRLYGDPEGRVIVLSERERECLRWAADGKTSWEIAQLLRISERTVNFHFDNTTAKLRASNRQHAVARAIALRILNPRPF